MSVTAGWVAENAEKPDSTQLVSKHWFKFMAHRAIENLPHREDCYYTVRPARRWRRRYEVRILDLT